MFVTDHMENSEDMCRLLQQRTFEFMWSRCMKRLRRGDECEFGPISITPKGIVNAKDKLLRWKELGTWKTDGNTLQIFKVKALLIPFVSIGIRDVPNIHLLMTLLETHDFWLEEIEEAEGAD